MGFDDPLYKEFLEEMGALENFRMSYAAAHPSASLDRDDPDVKRLIEALAFFSARTKRAGIRNIIASQRRIFQQFFSYLMSPLPAMAMLQAMPGGQFAETVLFPKGSGISVSPENGESAIFKTLHDLRVLPVSLEDVNMLLMPGKGYRLLLNLAAPYPRNDDIGWIQFHINHLNDFLTSLRVLHTLKRHLVRASVAFDEKVSESTHGELCEVSFGKRVDENEEEDLSHPLEKERLFFHFPWQELFMNVQVPKPSRNWRRFTLCLDLDAQWPRTLILNKDIFQLFVTPIINLRRKMAQPVLCNGTKERYAIRYPEMEYGFKLHSVLGVYEVTKSGMIPVTPGIVSGTTGSYEIEPSRDETAERDKYLILHFPEAFENPRTIAIDALWLQPQFSKTIDKRLQIVPYQRNIVGLRWELPLDIVPHTENRLTKDREGFLRLLTLVNKSIRSLDDLSEILRSMGSVIEGQFQPAYELLTEIRVEEAPQRNHEKEGMIKNVYYLHFKDFDTAIYPLLESFREHICYILDAWVSEAVVEVGIDVPEGNNV